MILICFDGSEDSRAAIQRAGKLLGGRSATVLTVWERLIDVLTHSSFGVAPMAGAVDFETLDGATERQAIATAAEGVELAHQAGLDAQPRTCALSSTVAGAILDQAEAVGASAIVVGSRGLTGVKSVLLGSVSHAILQHADRTVIVVPSPTVAQERRSSRRY